MHVLRWMRGPLPTGRHRATLATLVVAVGSIVGPSFVTPDPDMQDRLAATGIGFATLLLALGRPPFFWKSSIMKAWRAVFGDRGVALIYIALGLFFVIAPWAASRS